MISVIVPVAHDGAERDRNWAWVREHVYEDRGWEIIEAPDFTLREARSAEWSKGRAVNAAVELASHPVLVIADCDCYLHACDLDRALLALVCGAPWVVPHTTVYRLPERYTRDLIGNGRFRIPKRQHRGPAGGGIVVCTRDAFETVGGIDPGFTGWGGEDISFARALDTLVGPHVRLDATLWHLWHRPLPRTKDRRASPANEALAGLYAAAAGNPSAMAGLVIGRAAEVWRANREPFDPICRTVW